MHLWIYAFLRIYVCIRVVVVRVSVNRMLCMLLDALLVLIEIEWVKSNELESNICCACVST